MATHQQDSERENAILTNPSLLDQGVDYARNNLGGRWPEWEERVLEALESEREKALKHGPWCSLADECVRYAHEVIRGQWEALERRLVPNPLLGKALLDYMKKGIISVRWSEDRERELVYQPILGSTYAYAYARWVLKSPWQVGEQVILGSLRHDAYSRVCWAFGWDDATDVCATEYALHMRGGSWPEYERKVLAGECTPWVAVDYAEKLLGRPNPTIERNLVSWRSPSGCTVDEDKQVIALERYVGAFPQRIPYLWNLVGAGHCSPRVAVKLLTLLNQNKRCTTLEAWLFRHRASYEVSEAIFNYTVTVFSGNAEQGKKFLLAHRRKIKPAVFRTLVVLYAEKVIQGRWPAIEKWLVKSPRLMLKYADDVLKARLPDHLHTAMVMKSFEDTTNGFIKTYIGKYGKPRA